MSSFGHAETSVATVSQVVISIGGWVWQSQGLGEVKPGDRVAGAFAVSFPSSSPITHTSHLHPQPYSCPHIPCIVTNEWGRTEQ